MASWKKELVVELSKEIKEAKTVAILTMTNLPSKQLQLIRGKIGDKMNIRMSRKTLLTLALNNSGRKETAKLVEHLKDMPAIITSELDAFALWQLLKENMSDAAAKAGQIAPFDITVPAGLTNFAPGPILGDLGDVGINAGIEGGKIAIKEDSIVVKEGEPISEKLAAILDRLDIHPMKIGLNLIAALEDSTIFLRSTLDVDTDELIEKLKSAHLDSIKLAVGVGIINKETAELMLVKAETDAMKLAYAQGILADKVKELLLAKTEASAKTLKEKVEDIPIEEAKTEKKNELAQNEKADKSNSQDAKESETSDSEEQSSDSDKEKSKS